MRTDPSPGYDAVVLAGGRARRLGVDKPALTVAGRTLIDRVLDACAGAGRVVVVGPRRPTTAHVPVTWCREDPPGGGPVAGLLAGLEHVTADIVVVLAADLPLLGDTVGRLVAATVSGEPDPPDGAVLTDEEGRAQHLTAAYRRDPLHRALAHAAAGPGTPMRAVVSRLRLAPVPAGDAALDCDTWDDIHRAERLLRGGSDTADRPRS